MGAITFNAHAATTRFCGSLMQSQNSHFIMFAWMYFFLQCSFAAITIHWYHRGHFDHAIFDTCQLAFLLWRDPRIVRMIIHALLGIG